MNKSIFNVLKSPLFTSLQRHASKNVFKGWKDGIKYPGFTYYPRKPDFEDPPYNPTKLFRVERVKPLKGQPHWDRKILQILGLDEERVAIVKNIPENNARLWRVKHLIKISPITFPNGFPKDDEIDGSLLKENGEFITVKHLKPTTDELQVTEQNKNDPKRMDGNTVRRYLRMKWLNAWDLN